MDELAISKTEQQILDAAYRVFQKKGKAGARMQEIADEAGINKSMLHYYFRNKESLFRKIFLQSFSEFLGSVIPMMNNTQTNWQDKARVLTSHYIAFMRQRPDLPLFVINEINQDPSGFFNILKIESVLLQTTFFAQLHEAAINGEIRKIHPLQVFVSIVSGVIFPFIAAPMIKQAASLSDTDWDTFMNERGIIVQEMVITFLEKK